MAHGIFFGVGGKARKVPNLYIGVGGKARKIKAGWIGVGGKARLFYSASTSILAIMNKAYRSYAYWSSREYKWKHGTEYGLSSSFASISGNTLTANARYTGSIDYNGYAVKVTDSKINFSGKTKITIKYKVDGVGATLGGSTSHKAYVQLEYGANLPATGYDQDVDNGYTSIGTSDYLKSNQVNTVVTNTYNINISGSYYLMVMLEGIPCSVARDNPELAGRITLQSIELT